MKTIWGGLLMLSFLGAEMRAFPQPSNSYDALAFKLLTQTRAEAPGKNVFLSPVGLALTLSMAANGAAGDTATEIKTALQLDPEADLNAFNHGLLQRFAKLNPKIKLEIANILWTAADAQIKSPFLAVNHEFYRAEATSVDFSNPATAQKINEWVSQKTHGKIPTMVEPPLEGNRLILLDAIYFKGEWANPFDKNLTRDMPFTLGSGELIQQPRMTRAGDFGYYETDAFQAVRLPYDGFDVSAYIFLPKDDLDKFVDNLNPANWAEWLLHFQSRKGTLGMPRFKLENAYDLKPVLVAMGMVSAFGPGANFSEISSQKLYIDWIRQKTYVEFNEQGTVAAAVTGTGFRASVARPSPPPFQMLVDRPFFLAIRENQTGTILFLGSIVDPR